MIKTKVIKRYIQTLPIQDMIMRTDHLAESIQFELVNWIENIDYGAEGWQWFIYYRTTVDPPVVTPITYSISEDGNHVYLLWDVDHNITKRSGNLDFQIRGKRDTSDGLIEWNSSVATINLGRALDPDDHDTDENVLEWYLDRMEQLAQSGVADITAERERAIAAETEIREALQAEIERSVTKDNELEQRLDRLGEGSLEDITKIREDLIREIDRSTKEDIRLNNELLEQSDNLHQEIQAETERAEQAEAGLKSDITAETKRATEAELGLSKSITAESERAKQAETQLAEDLQTESDRAQKAERDLNSKINAESSRAQLAEQQIMKSLGEEILRAKTEEQALRDLIGDIDGNLADKLREEIERATAAEQALQEAIDKTDEALSNEVERAIAEENSLREALTAEISRAIEAEQNLREALDNEIARAEGRETELDDKIDAEINRATLAEENLQKSLDQTSEDLTDKIEAEAQRATEAEEQLRIDLDSEIQRSTTKDEALDNRITEVSADLGAQIQVLVQDLAEETTNRTSADTNLQRSIDTTNRTLSTLRSEFDAEVDRSTQQDTKLTDEIGSLVITQVPTPEAGYSFQFYLSLTRDGVSQQRGAMIGIPVTDAVTGGHFDEDTNELVLDLANGQEVRVPFNTLIQYYRAGDGIQISRVDEETNQFSIKLDTVNGTQNILTTSPDGLRINLGNYYTRGESDGLLATKQPNLLEEEVDPESAISKYQPSVQIDDSNTIAVNAQILSDLLSAFNQSNTNYAAIIQLSSTTVNGKYLGDQTTGTILRTDIVLYSGALVDDHVLVAHGTDGTYRDSGFTIKKSVPADAKFTDTLYYVTTEGNPEGLFTWAEKQKLEGIEPKAQVNVQSDWEADDGDAFIRNKPGLATPEIYGFMSPDDKDKLDTVERGAEVNQNAFSIIVIGDISTPAKSKTDTLTIVGEGSTTVSIDPETNTLTIKSEDVAQADWLEEDEQSPAFIKNKPGLATQAEYGFLSPEDKTKIDQLEDTYLALAGGTMAGTVSSQDVVPKTHDAYSFGSDTNRMKNVYATTGYFLGTPADGKGIFYNAETGGFDFIC